MFYAFQKGEYRTRCQAMKGGCIMSNHTYEQPDSSPFKQSYTVEEVAVILDMKIRTAYDFCNSTNDFVVKRIGSRTLRINKVSFDNWWNE